MYRDIDRDRDDNGVPDWQEDENYLDEAPRGAPVGMAGCLLGPLSLATVATVLGRVARHQRYHLNPGYPQPREARFHRGWITRLP
jgi:hypothetical protein